MAMFENDSWQVTDWGLEAVKPSPYQIEASRLLESHDRGFETYDWPVHLAEKDWVNLDEFCEAYGEALKQHAGKYEGTVDPARLIRSVLKAKRIRRNLLRT